MCDDLKPMFPNVSSPDDHFALDQVSVDLLQQCRCSPSCTMQPCIAFKLWKKAFLLNQDNIDQLDAFCSSKVSEETDACRELILWIWFRQHQRQVRSLAKRIPEDFIVLDDLTSP